jgi:hypothetical protein
MLWAPAKSNIPFKYVPTGLAVLFSFLILKVLRRYFYPDAEAEKQLFIAQSNTEPRPQHIQRNVLTDQSDKFVGYLTTFFSLGGYSASKDVRTVVRRQGFGRRRSRPPSICFHGIHLEWLEKITNRTRRSLYADRYPNRTPLHQTAQKILHGFTGLKTMNVRPVHQWLF